VLVFENVVECISIGGGGAWDFVLVGVERSIGLLCKARVLHVHVFVRLTLHASGLPHAA